MIQALLVAILAWLQQSQNPLAFWIFREPMMAGLWVGLIYGKPIQGIIVGAAINVAYLGWISAGGANSTDIHYAGLFGAVVALQSGLTNAQAVALAIPIGLIGNYIWVAWMSINSIWPNVQDKYAEKGEVGTIMRIQVLAGQTLAFLLRGIPAFLVALYGSKALQPIMANLPKWSINGLNTVGKVLPALGLAMLLKYIGRKDLMVFFAAGFIVAAYTGMIDLMFAALIGGVIAYVYVSLQSAHKDSTSKEAA